MKTDRYYSIDTLRFFANFCIVLAHTRVAYVRPWEDLQGAMFWIALIIYNICRMALPFFFIFAGYFYGRSLLKGGSLKKRYLETFKKLAAIFLCCSVLYVLFPRDGGHFLADSERYGWLRAYYWYLQDIVSGSPFLLLEGTKYHLWFLPALLIGLTVITVFHYFKEEKFLVYVFVASFMGMFIIKSLIPEIVISDDSYNPSGILKAVAFVTCGYLIAQQPRWQNRTACILIAVGILLLVIQNFWIWSNQIDPRSSVLSGNLLCTAGIFMLALNYPDWGKGHFVSKFGLLTLWIYGAHPFVLDQLEPLERYMPSWVWDLVFPVAVYAVSLAFVLLFQQLAVVRSSNATKKTKVEFSYDIEKKECNVSR